MSAEPERGSAAPREAVAPRARPPAFLAPGAPAAATEAGAAESAAVAKLRLASFTRLLLQV